MIGQIRVLSFGLVAFLVLSCGKKSKSSNGLPPFINSLATASDALGYSVKALSSARKSAPSAFVPIVESHSLLSTETQESSLLDCGNQGSAWIRGGGRMPVANDKFSETTFYCQLNSTQSQEQLLGSLVYYKQVLCSVEAAIGSIDYSEDGNTYNNQTIQLSESCGWSEGYPDKTLTANVTAFTMQTGDWQKRIRVQVPSRMLEHDIYFTIKSEMVALKVLDKWSKAHENSSADSGLRGTIFAVDIANNALRLESIDTYWSRRYRMLFRGELDQSSGYLQSVSEAQGIISNFDYNSPTLFAEVATVTGTEKEGFLYGNYSYAGDPSTIPTPLPSISVGSSRCSRMGGCLGLSPISFASNASDLEFLMVGVVWDTRTGKRSTVESWLMSAGFPAFDVVDKSLTL